MNIKYPIFITESGGNLQPFISLSELRSYLELIDIKNEVYEAHDCDGQLLKFVIKTYESKRKNWLGREITEYYEDFHLEPTHQPIQHQQFKEMLQETLTNKLSPEWINKASVFDLINEILFYFDKKWPNNGQE